MKNLFMIFLFTLPCFSQYNWETTSGITSGSPMGVLIEDSSKNYYFCNGNGPFVSDDLGYNWIWGEGGYMRLVKYLLVDNSDNLFFFHDSVFISSDKGKTFKSYKSFETPIPYSLSRYSFPCYFKDTVSCVSYYSVIDTINQMIDSSYYAINYSIDGGINFYKTISSFDKHPGNRIINLIHDSKGNYYFNYGNDGTYMINSIASIDKKLIFKYPYEYSDGSEILMIIQDTILIYQFSGVANYTNDYGQTWKTFVNQPVFFINSATNNNTYIGIDEENLWKTTDFGLTWELIYNYGGFLTAPPIPFITNDGICFLSFGYQDGGRDLLRGEKSTNIIKKIKDEYLLKIINNTSSIVFRDLVDFQLYNVTGNLLIDKNDVTMIDISYLSTGIYLFSLRINDKQFSGKFIR